MRLPFLNWHKDRIAKAEEAVEAAEAVHRKVTAQWPEVRRKAEWARATRERNHLTELFMNGRPQ